MNKYDVIIIGSGIAGLTCAIKMADYFEKNSPESKIAILTKGAEDESNTKYAQGGVAVVSDFSTDSFDKHIEDTMNGGGGYSDREIVEMVVKEGPQRINELIEWGAVFDKYNNGKYELGREGGHSENRVLHHKDFTGLEIQDKLLKKATKYRQIEVFSHHFVIDLITEHHLGKTVKLKNGKINNYGIYLMNLKNRQIEHISVKIVVIATGGVGQVYNNTTNPVVATGDGIAMAYRAKALIKDMEFVQFHPTGLYNPKDNPTFLVSEAVRGAGGVLRNKNGERFMYKYDERKSLAPRDIVARAIDTEMKKSGDFFVYLDCTHFEKGKFEKEFPKIHEKCISIGIRPEIDMIPVIPTAHYSCGGIVTDKNGRTTVNNLYCIGESASTGLHGANRLASNSLLEALVFANNAFEDIKSRIDKIVFREDIPVWNYEGTVEPKEKIMITHNLRELKILMSHFVSIVKSDIRLEFAKRRIVNLYKETEVIYKNSILSPQICELRNLISIAYLITNQAIQRKQNIGLHYNLDN